MGTGAPPTLRFLFMLMAAANLTALGMRLWPWQDLLNLPGNGVVAFDPAICLLAYIFFLYWIPSGATAPTRKALFTGSVMGLLAGGILFAQVLYRAEPTTLAIPNPTVVPPAMLIAAAAVWALAGLIGSRLADSVGMGILTSIWCAMVSGLIGCAAILNQMYTAAPVAVTQDPWKQYEGLAIGDAATQMLVQWLNSATWFLLVGPLVGAALGWLLSYFAALLKPVRP